MSTNERIVFPEPEEIAVEEHSIPEPGPNEVLIETKRTLVSTGTELANLTDMTGETTYPFHPGYNNIGTVVETGDEVTEEMIGERVASYGDHAQYVVATVPGPSVSAFGTYRPVPDGVTGDEAIFFTIAEIVMNGVRRGNVDWGETVVVFGLGLLGQFTTRLCHFAGARPVIGVDIAESRLSWLPDRQGITAINGREDYLASLRAATGGELADVVFELTGKPDAIPDEFDALGEYGRFVILSSPRGETRFNFNQQCSSPSHQIIGAHNNSHPSVATPENPWTHQRHAELFFDLVSSGDLDVTPLISHRRPYTDAPEIYESLLSDRSQAMGIVFEW